MAVYKDNATGTWRVIYRFTNWKGERKQTQKRGFATKREALAWEHEVMLKQGAKLDMTFASFFEIYEADKKQRVKESTWESKSHVIRTKILPYFGNRKIAEIEAKDVIAWQNELMAYRDEKGKPYSGDYLKTIHAQLTAIFNHAVNFYNLPYNPARRAGTMGNEVPKEMNFWTKEEYLAEYGDKPLGEFVREIVGLDMNAAKEAFSEYLEGANLDSRQIYFVNQIVEYIVHNGLMKDFSVLQEPPFTDQGSVVDIFTDMNVWLGIRKVIDGINDYLDRHHYSSVQEIVGALEL